MSRMTVTHATSPSSIAVLTIQQVAERLGCSKPHVYRLINTGALPAVDIAPPDSKRSKTRVRLDDLDSFLRNTRPLRTPHESN